MPIPSISLKIMQIDSVGLYAYSLAVRQIGERLISRWFYNVIAEDDLYTPLSIVGI